MELQLKIKIPKIAYQQKIGFLQFLLKLIVSNVLIQPHHLQIMICYKAFQATRLDTLLIKVCLPPHMLLTKRE